MKKTAVFEVAQNSELAALARLVDLASKEKHPLTKEEILRIYEEEGISEETANVQLNLQYSFQGLYQRKKTAGGGFQYVPVNAAVCHELMKSNPDVHDLYRRKEESDTDSRYEPISGRQAHDQVMRSAFVLHGLFVLTPQGTYECRIPSGHVFHMRMGDLEKEAVRNALNKKQAELFLSKDEIAELQGNLEDVSPGWDEEEEIEKRVASRSDRSDPHLAEKFRTIFSAIRRQRPLRITNRTMSGKEAVSVVWPMGLEYTASRDLWTLNAWLPVQDGVKEERSINVNVRRLSAIEEYSDLSGVEREKYASLMGHIIPREAKGKYTGFLQERKRFVRLRIPRINYLSDVIFRRFSYYERETSLVQETDGKEYYIMKVGYYGFDEMSLIRSILEAGPKVLVSSRRTAENDRSPEIREKVMEEIQKTIALYQ